MLAMPYYNESTVYKDKPPVYSYDNAIETAKYLFTFDSITTEYTYIDFGVVQVTQETITRSNYPNRIRVYNKGKLVNNTFSWYSYYEKVNRNNVVISAGDGNADSQLNYSQSNYYRKYYWICV